MQIAIEKLPVLLGALPTTFFILIVSVAIALVFGTVLTMMKLSRYRVVRGVASVYISFMRGTPMVAQLLIAFIGLPLLLRESFGIAMSGSTNMTCAIIAFSLNESAFFAEIFRSAYLAIDHGQIEAAESIGMNKVQVFLHVTLPQTAMSALPNTTNMIIELMKNTSVGLAIGVVDLMGMAKQVSYNTMGVGQTPIYLETAVLYWIIGVIMMALSSVVTKRLNRCDEPTAAVSRRRLKKTGGERA